VPYPGGLGLTPAAVVALFGTGPASVEVPLGPTSTPRQARLRGSSSLLAGCHKDRSPSLLGEPIREVATNREPAP
jgi:hypothetical protein